MIDKVIKCLILRNNKKLSGIKGSLDENAPEVVSPPRLPLNSFLLGEQNVNRQRLSNPKF